MSLIDTIKRIHNNFPAYIKRYIWPLPIFRKEIVVMIDGTQVHGGLTDRFRHILSVYSYCKNNNIRFRLYYVYPCNIQFLFQPNKYDWSIKEEDISYSFYDHKELYLYVDIYNGQYKKTTNAINNERHLSILNQILNNSSKIQYHVYGNSYFAQGQYKLLFEELFRPTNYLKNKIAEYHKYITEPYEAVTLRFQQLLGDFKEGQYPILSLEDRKHLITKCINKINTLYKEGYFSTERILITSDSPTFIEEIQKSLSYVYTISGKMEHMDFTTNDDLDMNSKSFIDLILLSEAHKLTLLKTELMYPSGFPKFAAELGNKPYTELRF